MPDSQIDSPEPTPGGAARVRLQTNKEIGAYVLEECRVQGSGYQVWGAHRTVAGTRPIDLFLLEPKWAQKEGCREHFIVSAQRAAAVRHPNLFRVYGAQTTSGFSFAVLERDEYLPLDEVLTQGGLAWGVAASVALGITQAIQELHMHGSVHGAIGVEALRINAHGQAKVGGLGLTWIDPAGADRCSDVREVARLVWTLMAGYPSVPPELGPPPDARLLRAPEVWSVLSRILENPDAPAALSELSHWLELSPEVHDGPEHLAGYFRAWELADATLAESLAPSDGSGRAQPNIEVSEAQANNQLEPTVAQIPQPRPASPTMIHWGAPAGVDGDDSARSRIRRPSVSSEVLDAFKLGEDSLGPAPPRKPSRGRRVRLPKTNEIVDAVRSIPTQKVPPLGSDPPETKDRVVADTSRTSSHLIQPPDGELRRIAKRRRVTSPDGEVAKNTEETTSVQENPWLTYLLLIVALVLGAVAFFLAIILLVR
ncbi:MAG: hypothetical protein KTR25_00025 [Myxococcales bacterium]|nr:hypothetical protein [Myxococcales bacterium]